MFTYKLIGIGIFISLCIGYYTYTQNKIETLTTNTAKLELVNKTNQETITIVKENAVQLQKANDKLTKALSKAETYNTELRNTLQKHNLTMLAKKKSGLIEKRINDASKKLFTDITNDTAF